MQNYTNQVPPEYQQNNAYSQPYNRPYPQRRFISPFEAAKRRSTRTGIALISSVGAMYAFIFICMLIYIFYSIFGIINLGDTAYAVVTELISCIGAYVIAPVVLWLILKNMPCRDPQKHTADPVRFCKWIFIALGLDLGISLISSMVLGVLGSVFNTGFSNLTQSADVPWIVTFLTTVILAPIVEEIMFRQILLRRLLPDGELYAIVISGIAFGLFHLNYYQFFYAAALGFFFALIIVKTGNLWYTIALHMIINFLGSVQTMWLSNAPALTVTYEIFLIILMAAGIVILAADIIKKDCTPEAAAFPKPTGRWRAAVKSPGMVVCWSVLGGISLIMTYVMLAIY